MSDAPDADGPAGLFPAAPGSTGPPEGLEAVQEMVRAVAAWYNGQIVRERRAATPDQERLEELLRLRQVCVADQQALPQASPQEVARIAVVYEAWFRELTQE